MNLPPPLALSVLLITMLNQNLWAQSKQVLIAELPVASPPVTMSQLNELVPKLVSKNVEHPGSALEEYAVKSSTEFIQLSALCSSNWSAVIDDFESITSGDDGKVIVLSAFEGLSAADYMTALERIAELYRKNQISKKVLKSIIRPTGRMRAFLADNYQHQRVQTLLNGLKEKLKADANMVSFINAVTSGKQKSGIDDFREGHRGLSVGDIPKVLLQP